jgi:hypothetical protein
LPFFPACDPVDFFIVEHAVAYTKARDDRVGTSDADSGEVFRRGVQDGVDVTAMVGVVLVGSANVAVAWFVDLFVVKRCNCGVDNDSPVEGVIVGFGAGSVP